MNTQEEAYNANIRILKENIAKDGHKLIEYNIHLKTIYKCAKSLFNKIDKDLYFNDEDFRFPISCRGMLNNIHLSTYHREGTINFQNPFGFDIYKKQSNDNIIYTGIPNVWVGLYFPYHNIGDEIKISMYKFEYIIKITNTNKIYLPNKDIKFLFTYPCCGQVKISGHNGTPFYIISPTSDPYFNNIPNKFLLSIHQHRNLAFLDNFFTYAEEASAEIIQKAWRNYIKRKTLNKWKCNIKDVNNEIEYMPGIGVNYYDAMNNFKTLI